MRAETDEALNYLAQVGDWTSDKVWEQDACAARVVALIESLQAEVLRLECLVYVPGLWRCAKCNFQLFQSSLNGNTGAVGVRDTPGDKCPNCGTPLWRVTERQAGNDLVDRWRTELERANTAEAALARAQPEKR